jgi:excisionase family DNA binding protein
MLSGNIEQTILELVRQAVRQVIREEVTNTLLRRQDATLKEWLNTAEAAELAGLSEWTVRQWIKLGRVAASKLGRQWRIRREDLLAAVKSPAPETVSENSETEHLRTAKERLRGGRGEPKLKSGA